MKLSVEASLEQQIVDLRKALRTAQLNEQKAKLKTADYVAVSYTHLTLPTNREV